MGEKNFIVIQLRTGEIVVTMTEDSQPLDDTNIDLLEVEYPAMLIPMPPQVQGQQENQIGFRMYFPFSKQEGGVIKKSEIISLSTPLDDFRRAYDGWVTQIKAKESGIVMAR